MKCIIYLYKNKFNIRSYLTFIAVITYNNILASFFSQRNIYNPMSISRSIQIWQKKKGKDVFFSRIIDFHFNAIEWSNDISIYISISSMPKGGQLNWEFEIRLWKWTWY